MENHLRLKQGLEICGLELDDEVLRREIAFLEEMLRWNQRINLTAIRNLTVGLEKHLIDSLVLLPWLTSGRLLDVGTGAGLPGIPLAIARPDVQITSVEAVAKKVSFQRHIRRTFKLSNFDARNCRIEALGAGIEYGQITARAFASIEKILRLVSPYLADEGQLLLLRGSCDETDQPANQAALAEFKFEIIKKTSYQLPFSGAWRQIVQIRKPGS